MKDYNLINQRATTCKHGGHCEWVACDKCNHYEPDSLNQQPCDVIEFINRQVSLLEERMSSATNEGRWVEEEKCQYAIENLELVDEYIKAHPPVTPKEKTGKWYSTTIQGQIDGQIVKAFVCSECGAISVFRLVDGEIVNGDLCPNCGAKIQEVEE